MSGNSIASRVCELFAERRCSHKEFAAARYYCGTPDTQGSSSSRPQVVIQGAENGLQIAVELFI